MKKNYFLFVLLSVGLYLTSYAQLLTEDFSSGVPPTGWTIDAQAGNWAQRNTNNAGGTAPEARLHWSPQFNGDSRLISPVMDLTGVNTAILTFKHTVDHYGAGYTVGVATRSNNGAWNTVWSMPGANISETKSIIISNTDVNQSNFQVCFFFSGNSYQINDWYIDDVSLIAASNIDLAGLEITVPDFINQGNQNIEATFVNLGTTPITSFDATYQIDGMNDVTQSFSGLNLQITNTYNIVFTSPWNATVGLHNVSVSISNVNGNGNDDVAANDTVSKTVNVASQSVANFPLFEEFTSSTCAPCATFNTNSMNPFMTNHPNDIAVVKYQMNWPGNGDPYYTAEGGVRRSYYGVNGVPSIIIGGKVASTSTAGLTNGLNSENSKQAYLNIDANYHLNGNIITVNVNVDPYVNGTFTIHTVVIEKQTTGNVATNGETEFENVMMKMLPDANGHSVSLADGQMYSFSENFDMSSTNVEELSDLAVVVFVQNDTDKQIMQSKYVASPTASTEDLIFNSVKVFPNPTKDKLNIASENVVNISIKDLLGKEILSKINILNTTIDLNHLNNGVYFVEVDNGTTKGTKKIILNK